MNSLVKLNPPFIYKFFIISMLVIWIIPGDKILSFPWTLFGLPLLVSGSMVALRAKKIFLKNGTPIQPNADPIHLHQKDVFNYSRNPMYLGIMVTLAGIAIMTGHLINLTFPIIFFWVMDRHFIYNEERNLEEKFGDAFKRYQQRTRKWI